VLCLVSVHKKVRCKHYILQCESGTWTDYLRSRLSGATGDYMLQSTSSFSTLRGNPLGLHSGVSMPNGNIKIAYEYIDVVYLLSLL